MSRALAIATLFAGAALLRLHNAWAAPPLSGFDGPFHAAYIGVIHFEGRLPLGYESWATSHPPLYYAVCAWIWNLLPEGADPRHVLFAMRGVSVASSLALGLAVFYSARRLFPARPWLPVYAAALALFVPMHIGPASLIGNEISAAALCGVAVLLLLRCLERPDSLRGALLLGAVLGLGALSKVSALLVLAVGGALVLLRGLGEHGWRPSAARQAALVVLAATLVSGWWFAGNAIRYGQPLLMENEIVARLMQKQGYGKRRPVQAYFDLGPRILMEPAARGPLATTPVWPVTFASLWFDIHGTLVSVRAPLASGFARFLFACGGVFALTTVVGAFALLTRRARTPVPLGREALLLLATVPLLAYVAFTYRVATFSVLKATYLSPGLVAYASLSALGIDELSRGSRGAGMALRGLLGTFVLAVCLIFWSGGLAPLKRNPAELYVRAYSDAPSQRVYDYFVAGSGPRGRARSGPASGSR